MTGDPGPCWRCQMADRREHLAHTIEARADTLASHRRARGRQKEALLGMSQLESSPLLRELAQEIELLNQQEEQIREHARDWRQRAEEIRCTPEDTPCTRTRIL